MSEGVTNRMVDVAEMVRDAGLDDLEPGVRAELVDVLTEYLEYRIGASLTALMTAAELTAYLASVDCGDEAGAAAVLSRAVPYFRTVVDGHAGAVGTELVAVAERIRAAVSEAP